MSPMKRRFERMCALLAARRCFNAGQTIDQIAKSAKRSKSTIRRWLKVTA